MNTMDLVAEVGKINIKEGNAGLFVWFIGHCHGGIGRHYSNNQVDWNIVTGFSKYPEMIMSLARLQEKYETREGPETG